MNASTEDAFQFAATKAVRATFAIDQHEKVHGRKLNEAARIACPNCKLEDTLRFVRTGHHLFVECETPGCTPSFRGSYRK